MRRALIGLLAVAALVLAGLGVSRLIDPVVRIPGIAGPAGATPLPAPPPAASPDGFPATGGRSALALWVTDPDSDWLSLAFGLRSIGVPLVVTTDAARATQHAVHHLPVIGCGEDEDARRWAGERGGAALRGIKGAQLVLSVVMGRISTSSIP